MSTMFADTLLIVFISVCTALLAEGEPGRPRLCAGGGRQLPGAGEGAALGRGAAVKWGLGSPEAPHGEDSGESPPNSAEFCSKALGIGVIHSMGGG